MRIRAFLSAKQAQNTGTECTYQLWFLRDKGILELWQFVEVTKNACIVVCFADLASTSLYFDARLLAFFFFVTEVAVTNFRFSANTFKLSQKMKIHTRDLRHNKL